MDLTGPAVVLLLLLLLTNQINNAPYCLPSGLLV